MRAYSEQTFDTYYIHAETKNTSFLKMTVLLDSMGVTNCYFHLKLYDKDLIDINPYSKKLSDEMRFKIFIECSNNRWYFYREVFRVSEGGAGTGVGGGSPFILNRGNLAYLWAMELNLSTYLIMPRQTGKTWAAIADAVWTHHFIRGSTILHFNKNLKDATDNIRRMQQSIRMLPEWMQHSSLDNLNGSEKRLVKNNEKTIINTIGSTVEAMASAGNESKADAIARGKTASKIWYDELAYIFFNETIYAAATPAYEKAREIAEKNDVPYAISITTTPGDLATPHGAWAYKMMNDSVVFREEFYNYTWKKLNRQVNHNPDKIPFIFIQYSYLQLGETEEWYLERYKKLNNPIRARREYLLEWMNTNGNSPFDPDDVEVIGEYSRAREEKAKVVRINKFYEMIVYDKYTGKKPVIIGSDVSMGRGRDSSTLVVVNPETLHPIAIFKSNMIDGNKFRKLIMTVINRMYPNCILAIESNPIGEQLIKELLDTPVGRCMYKERKKRTVEQPGVGPVPVKRKVNSVEYGFNTNTVTRPQMMEMLESIVHNSPSHLGYKELYEEIRFMELKHGRIDHGENSHDDVTMAYLGALWIIRYGTGLKGRGIYYNIDSGNEGLDDVKYDTTESMKFAEKLMRKKKRALKKQKMSDVDLEEASDDLVDFLSREHHVQTSSDLYQQERAEYFKEIDRIQGLSLDDEEETHKLSPDIDNLILRNYNALLASSEIDPDDPISSLLKPISQQDSYGGYGFMDDYKW